MWLQETVRQGPWTVWHLEELKQRKNSAAVGSTMMEDLMEFASHLQKELKWKPS